MLFLFIISSIFLPNSVFIFLETSRLSLSSLAILLFNEYLGEGVKNGRSMKLVLVLSIAEVKN